MSAPHARVGIDIGGTSTDLVLDILVKEVAPRLG